MPSTAYERRHKPATDRPVELDSVAPDLGGVVRPGDTLVWGQGAAEPVTLTRALVDQRRELSDDGKERLSIFLGVLKGETLRADYVDTFRYFGLGGLGDTSKLSRQGVVETMPIRLSSLPSLFDSGYLHADVVFIQLSEPNEQGVCSTGLVGDFMHEAIRAARTVVGEVNPNVPFTYGDTLVPVSDLDYVVHTDVPLVQWPVGASSPEAAAVARNVAELIPDGATLQLGIGAIPEALCAALTDKRDLGIHSGMIGDTVLDLIESGAVTNARKPVDTGITTTGLVMGTERLTKWAHRNEALGVRSLDHTHSAAVLAQLPDLWSINSAIEMDLTGQVNAEMMGDKYAGGVGGQVDFTQAAMSSERGRSVIAFPSTAAKGRFSRIVAKIASGVVTTPRSNADLFVTEYGVADLRAATLEQRAERLIAIAHPDHRDVLRASLS